MAPAKAPPLTLPAPQQPADQLTIGARHDETPARRAAAELAYQRGDLMEAERQITAAIVAARKAGRPPSDIAMLSFDRALFVELRGDRMAARTLYAGLMKDATERGDPGLLARLHSQLSASHNATGDLNTARDHGLQALSLAEAARDLIAQGNALRNLGVLARASGNLPEAIARFEKALEVFRATAQPDYLAGTLATLASMETERGRLGVAQGHVEDGLKLRATPPSRVTLLSAAAGVADARGDWAAAERVYAELEASPALASQANGRTGVLISLCGIRAHLRLASAEDTCRQALKESEANGAPDQIARALYNQAGERYAAGQREEAIALLQRALSTWESSGSTSTRYAVLTRSQLEKIASNRPVDLSPVDPRAARVSDQTTQAVALYGRGEYVQAERLLIMTLALAHQLEDDDAQAMVLGNLGYVKLGQQRFDAARVYAEQSLAISERIGADHRTWVQLLLLGKSQALTGQADEALKTFERGLAMVRGMSSAHEAEYLGDIGVWHEQKRNFAEALRRHEEAAQVWTRLDDRKRLGMSLFQAARDEFMLRRLDAAQVRLKEALDASRTVGHAETEHAIWMLQGDIDVQQKRFDDAERHLLAALQLALQARAPEQTRASYERLIALDGRGGSGGSGRSAADWRRERDEVLAGRVASQWQSAQLASQLGAIALQLNDKAEARLYLQRAVTLYRAMDRANTDEGRRAQQRLDALG